MTRSTPLRKPATAKIPPKAAPSFEQACMLIEDICMDIQQGQFTHGKGDEDRLYWQQKLKNIVTPVSLALSEYKGPRVFHQHYKHREDDDAVLTPVMESSRDNLVRACERALYESESLMGMKGSKLVAEKARLEKALQQLIIVS
jgi:hypothetical protein